MLKYLQKLGASYVCLYHLRGEILTSKIITKKNFEVTNIFTEVPEENHQILSFFK